MAKITYEIQFGRNYEPMTEIRKKQIHTIIYIIERKYRCECDQFQGGIDFNFDNLDEFCSDAVIESFFDIYYYYAEEANNDEEIIKEVYELFCKMKDKYKEADFEWYISDQSFDNDEDLG